MKRQLEVGVLLLLLVGLAVLVYFRFFQGQVTQTVTAAQGDYTPIGVQDPALRFDLLQKIRSFEYSGRHRNIFSMTMSPPDVSRESHPQPNPVPIPPSGPPPVVVPVKFFGYASDPKTGVKHAFFTDGDDVFILSEGETLQRRFRLLHIGNSSAEFEEISSQRHATIPLEDQGPGV
jgi:hypothetical protein